MKKINRILSLILVLSIAVSCIAIPVFADENYGGRITVDKNEVTGGTGYKNSPFLNAVDGDYSTYYDGLQGQYVQIKLDKKYEISAIGYVARSGNNMVERMTGGIFEGSTDGENWVTLYTVTEPKYINASTSVKIPASDFESENSSFSYIRYSVPAEQYCNIAEIELYSLELEPEPSREPEPEKEQKDEYVYYDDFKTYYADESVEGKEGWTMGGSDASRSLKKRIDELNGDMPYVEFTRASSGNSAFAYNSFDAVTDTVIYEFDIRMTGGSGAVGLQKSG